LSYYSSDTRALYDFLYRNEYEAYLMNIANKEARGGCRDMAEFVMKLHTGETIVSATKDWDWEARQKLGNRILEDLAADFLAIERQHSWDLRESEEDKLRKELIKNLELDGYSYQEDRLLYSEASVLDTEEEEGVLDRLMIELKLPDYDVAKHHLEQSAVHYTEGRWDDCISNARKVLESVLSQSAQVYSTSVQGSPLSQVKLQRPVDVRDYLEQEKLLEAKEKKALSEVYGLLSNTGGHPYIAEKEQARLMRHLALTFTQFVLLRLQGAMRAAGVLA
jgi:hypothetical protein